MLRIRIPFILLFFSFSFLSYSQTIKGTYAIKNIETEMLLRPEGANKSDNTPIVLYSPTNWKCLTWDFINVENNIYQLRNLFTNKTFQPKVSENKDKIELEQLPLKSGQNNQHWEFIEVSENQYLIKLSGTDFYITPKNSSGAENSQVYLETKRKDSLQLWTIYEQNPTH